MSTNQTMMRLKVTDIVMHKSAQPRDELDWVTIMSYAEDMKAGDEFPPVVVFDDGRTYWLADGFHRVRAALEAKLSEIPADVRQGTLQDAQWYSYSANQKQGLRRTNADKRRAVEAALAHPYQSKNSDGQIAAHVGVSREYVNRLANRPSSDRSHDRDERTVTRGDSTYTMATGNIGNGSGASGENLQPVELTPVKEPAFSHDRDLWEEYQVSMATADRVVIIDPYLASIPVILKTIERLQEYVERKRLQQQRN